MSSESTSNKTKITSDLDKTRKGGFWLRKWDSLDIVNFCWLTTMHMLAACAPFVFDLCAFRVGGYLAVINGLGLSLAYHRLLTHRSFKVPIWLEYFFAYCGVHGGQRDPIFWVSTHKYHHKVADTDRDPHSPVEGFWFSHIGWICHNSYIASKCGESRSGEYSNVPELKAQWFYRFLHDTYFWHHFVVATLLYLYGGFPYLAWGMGMRLVVVFHITFSIGSFGHLWGERPWNTPDTSTNNWWIAVLAFGEGWHNNHHAFPKSAQTGLEWWQVDTTWDVIKLLSLVGLATDIKSPTEADKRRKALMFDSKKTT